MKFALTAALTMALWVAAAIAPGDAQATCLTPAGDITNDGTSDVLDLQCGILVVLHELTDAVTPLPACLQVPLIAVDLNCDSPLWDPHVNVSDLILFISLLTALFRGVLKTLTFRWA